MGDIREAEEMARMISGREPAVGGGSSQVTQEGAGACGWSGEDLGPEKRGAAQETSPRRSGNLGEREPAGVGAGQGGSGGPARWAGLVDASLCLSFPLVILLSSGTQYY